MQELSAHTHRKTLLDLLQCGLAAVDGYRCVKHFLEHHPLLAEQVALVAIGKAASSMAQGTIEILGSQFSSGLVITKHGYLARQLVGIENLTAIESSHPVPDESSLLAGQVLVDFLAQLPSDLPVIFLISGGASALVEVLPEGLGIADLQKTNQWLLASGLPIARMNVVRKAISQIKAGRLAGQLGRRQALNLLLSDVPNDDPAVIGSGLLVPDQSSLDLSSSELPDSLPDWLGELIGLNSPPLEVNDPVFRQIESHIIGSNQQACAAICKQAELLGYRASMQSSPLSGDTAEMANRISDELARAEPGLLIWGGETTVVLPENPGRGGRNQHLALSLALQIQGDTCYQILVAATDGSDGPTDDAGALIDGQTIQRGEQEGFSARECLQQADSGRFLEASGDLISTGPTGTNVMDLVLAIKV